MLVAGNLKTCACKGVGVVDSSGKTGVDQDDLVAKWIDNLVTVTVPKAKEEWLQESNNDRARRNRVDLKKIAKIARALHPEEFLDERERKALKVGMWRYVWVPVALGIVAVALAVYLN